MISAQWTIVGAGPAGILAVGRLLDAGVAVNEILWLDPEFKVGDFGKYWSQVPSNTRVELFTNFLLSTQSFDYDDCPVDISLTQLNQQDGCLLGDMTKALQWVSDGLCDKVAHKKCLVESLHHVDNGWLLTTDMPETVFSKNVILATGAEPKKLNYDVQKNEIDLFIALNPLLLKSKVAAKEHVVVFGASHSGVLVIKNLLEAGCRVTNFYRSPIKYALHQDDHIIYDNTGLKGVAARWAKEHLHGQEISNLKRCYFSDDVVLESFLHDVDHVVYATGFSPRLIASSHVDSRCYDARTGIIAPGLFGLGIAYPEEVVDRYGIREHSIGLFKFSNYMTKVLPLWLRYAGLC